MNRIAVVALVVFGLAAAAQAQEVKAKSSEPVKKTPSETVKPAVVPVVKTVATKTEGKTTETLKKEETGKVATTSGTAREGGKMKKIHHHGTKKTGEAKGPDQK
jgi:hypothetical protein